MIWLVVSSTSTLSTAVELVSASIVSRPYPFGWLSPPREEGSMLRTIMLSFCGIKSPNRKLSMYQPDSLLLTEGKLTFS